MSEMIERVARAIASCESSDDWDDLGLHWREQFSKEARAAIAAMREPTERMTVMGSLMLPEGVDLGYAEQCWKEMIDEALK